MTQNSIKLGWSSEEVDESQTQGGGDFDENGGEA